MSPPLASTLPSAAVLDLAWLLHPQSPQAFFAGAWERATLHRARHDAQYYRDLMTSADLERLLSHSDLRYPALRLAKGGRFLAPESYTRDVKYGDEVFERVPDPARVAAEYRAGATLSLPAIHRSCEPVGRLCAALEAELDHIVHANLYLTPGNAAGFTPHYDPHEVLVLQLAGRKRWTLRPPPIPLPHRGDPFSPERDVPAAPLATCDLEAGDLLYLPRGFVHSTVTHASYSAHLTIGIGVFTWADLAKGLAGLDTGGIEWRQALPPGFAHRAALRPVLRARLGAALERLGRGDDPDALVEAFLARLAARRERPAEPFPLAVTVIGAESRLRVRADSAYRLSLEGTRAILEFRGTRHHLPIAAARSLQAMRDAEVFRCVELPGELSSEAKLGLGRYLLEAGFLELAPPL